jgi:hypothetical protein
MFEGIIRNCQFRLRAQILFSKNIPSSFKKSPTESPKYQSCGVLIPVILACKAKLYRFRLLKNFEIPNQFISRSWNNGHGQETMYGLIGIVDFSKFQFEKG